MGDYEFISLGIKESPMKYHSAKIEILILYRKPDKRQFLVGSLTGAVTSQKVTEVYKGFLRSLSNRFCIV